ncbi:MAG: M56 family metallopeptidase [Ancrocorticia sp.]|jgi:Zn-dependent protease with chaperone function|nr:M56 family metallopeptidase [Ancrocorticia sp.]MCI2001431.1 M56 family metallopeptidase [Ancrocorticia sp.]MCI2028876.1 M56 family metallopeptidase [Ancrocorticia sp.]
MDAALPLALAATLIALGLSGDFLVRAAAPVLMRIPRAAPIILTFSMVAWLLAVASYSLMLTWIFTGPTILSEYLTGICQRCVAAASPFHTIGGIRTGIPAVLLMLLPLAAMLVAVSLGVVKMMRDRRVARDLAEQIIQTATPTAIGGHRVMLINTAEIVAYSLPRAYGGIVLSTGVIQLLNSEELTAVVEHENAHVQQRHHLFIAVLSILGWPLQWIPLVRACVTAAPIYLEIASDHAACRCTSTPALASALLKLGPLSSEQKRQERAPHHTRQLIPAYATALHAAGPARIEQLVCPARVRPALLPFAVLGIVVGTLAVAAALVQIPYLLAVFSGCPVPVH